MILDFLAGMYAECPLFGPFLTSFFTFCLAPFGRVCWKIHFFSNLFSYGPLFKWDDQTDNETHLHFDLVLDHSLLLSWWGSGNYPTCVKLLLVFSVEHTPRKQRDSKAPNLSHHSNPPRESMNISSRENRTLANNVSNSTKCSNNDITMTITQQYW